MEKTTKLTKSSDLYNKIDALALPAATHGEAVDAARTADKLVNALYWVLGKLGQLRAWLNPYPKFKSE